MMHHTTCGCMQGWQRRETALSELANGETIPDHHELVRLPLVSFCICQRGERRHEIFFERDWNVAYRAHCGRAWSEFRFVSFCIAKGESVVTKFYLTET